MQNRSKKYIQILCLILFLSLSAPISAAFFPLTDVSAEEGGSINGTVRVYLASLGNITDLDITPTAGASLEFSDTIPVPQSANVHLSADRKSGTITASVNGVRYTCGKALILSGAGFRIAQSLVSTNTYPGSLLISSQGSENDYHLTVIAYIKIEDYLVGVLPYEMGITAPLEALKAQAVCARTYSLRAMQNASGKTYDVTDTIQDQVYRGTSITAVNCYQAISSTNGIAVLYGNSLASVYYTASNGGQTESAANAWGSSGYPYLKIKDDPYDAQNSDAKSASFSVTAVGRQINNQLGYLLNKSASSKLLTDASVEQVLSVTPSAPRYASPSRLYTKLNFDVIAITSMGYRNIVLQFDIFKDLAQPLNMNLGTLNNELWSVTNTTTGFKVTAKRWGHGVGMSQRGAMTMAQYGFSYENILSFYFEGTHLKSYTYSYRQPQLSDYKEEELTELDAYATVTTVSGSLNLRSFPSTLASVLRQIPQGTIIRVLAANSDWCKVEYEGTQGYVMRKFLTFTAIMTPEPQSTETVPIITPSASPTPTAMPYAYKKMYVSTPGGSLNLREKPSLNARVLTKIPQGTKLTVVPYDSSWMSVAYNGFTGYVMTVFLKEDSATAAPVVTARPSDDPSHTPRTAYVSTPGGSLNLREKMSLTSRVLTTIPQGTKLTVTVIDSIWCAVTYRQMSGYVISSFLRFAEDPVVTLPPQPVTPGPTEYITVFPTVTAYITPGPYTASPTAIQTEIPTASPTAIPTAVPTAAPTKAPDVHLIPLKREMPAKVMPDGNWLRLRDNPSDLYMVLKDMRKGDFVIVTAMDDEWCELTHEGTHGYCLRKYLELPDDLQSYLR